MPLMQNVPVIAEIARLQPELAASQFFRRGNAVCKGTAPACGRLEAANHRFCAVHEENILLPLEQDDHLSVPSPILVVIADKEQSSRDEMRRKVNALPFASVAAEVADNSVVLDVMRREHPDVLLMASGFLEAHPARSIAERSFCTKLPMVATYRFESVTSASLADCLLSGLEPNPTRSFRNSLEILRTWSEALENASGLPVEERVIVAKIHGRLGLLFSSAVLSIRDSVPLPTLVTRWNDHQAVEGLDKIFSKDDPQSFFEAGPGVWINLDRMGQLQKKLAAEEPMPPVAPDLPLVRLVLVPKLRNQTLRYLNRGRNN